MFENFRIEFTSSKKLPLFLLTEKVINNAAFYKLKRKSLLLAFCLNMTLIRRAKVIILISFLSNFHTLKLLIKASIRFKNDQLAEMCSFKVFTICHAIKRSWRGKLESKKQLINFIYRSFILQRMWRIWYWKAFHFCRVQGCWSKIIIKTEFMSNKSYVLD